MAKFLMDDDTVVDTDKAADSWEEDTFWDGRNHISRATGSQWEHETLYLSAKGRYYAVHSSQWQGGRDLARWLGKADACRWLLANGCELPEDLKPLESEVSE